ncbi:MAG: MetQ/NlpA family ABC transporter substrate-binding protein [Aerococcus sp.]|nr:MetQ/NlpA family ABC transporter substrate-binding protein [Aerococcus sp.]
MMKKTYGISLLLLAVVVLMSACGLGGGDSSMQTIKVGVVGDQQDAWEHVKDKVKDQGIKLELVKMNDYVTPNTALADGSIDLNAFQTVQYLEEWNKERHTDLVSVGFTYVEPMGIYSDQVKDLKDVPDGGQVTLPDDKTNEARGLRTLEKAGLIKLKENVDFPTVADVTENPHHLSLQTMSAEQLPQAKSDPKVALAVINNNYAVEAGLSIDDALYKEPSEGTEPFWNIIAARGKDKDNETYRKIVDAFQSKDTADVLKKASDGNQVPVFDN